MTVPAPPRLGVLVALVAVGGAAGALARWGLGLALPHGPDALPVATLLVNVSGSLLLGVLVGRWPHATRARALLGTGVLGGFTTASTLALELDRLLARAPAVAVGYLALTLAGGVLAAGAGLRLGRG